MSDVPTQSLGDTIRVARVASTRSLRDVARTLDITPSYMSDIENDRRVPAEDVLRSIARLLALDFDDLMARAGRLGEQAERYLRRNPAAGTLFRRITQNNLDDGELKELIEKADDLGKKGDPP